MKKITLILITLLAFVYANAQDYTVPRGLPYKDTRWVENVGVAGASYLFDSLTMFRNMGDTQMKPLYPALAFILDFDGDSTFWVWDTFRWKKLATGGGGGTGSNNTNLGAAYRWLNETSQGIKTVNKGFGIGLDSLTTGEIRITADTSQLPTRYTIDSLGLLVPPFFSLTTIGASPNANGASYNSTTGVYNQQPYSRAFGGVTTASNTAQFAQGQKDWFSSTDTISAYYGLNFNQTSETRRSTLLGTGRQIWAITNGVSELGTLSYSTPDSLIGIVIQNASGAGRAQFRQYRDTGGISLGTGATGAIPGNQVVLLNNGHLIVSGFTDATNTQVTDLGYLFQDMGSAYHDGKTYLGTVAAGLTSDSILVIHNMEVKKVASATFGSGTVTSVATSNSTGITGGTITTTGTLAIDTLLISTRAWRQKLADSLSVVIHATSLDTVNVSNVIAYGADSTGVVDATAAFNNAVNASTLNGKFRVYIPHGTYKITVAALKAGSQVNKQGIQLVNNIEIFGDGVGKTTIKAAAQATGDTSTYNWYPIFNGFMGSISNVKIHDLSVNGNQANIAIYSANPYTNPTGHNDTSKHYSIQGIYFKDGDNDEVYRVKIDSCQGFGVEAYDATNVNVHHSTFTTNGNGGVGYTSNAGVRAATGTLSYCLITNNNSDNVRILDQNGQVNVLYNELSYSQANASATNWFAGVYVLGTNNVVIKGNYIHDNSAYGIDVGGTDSTSVAGMAITDNYVFRNGNGAIISGGGYSTISNNWLYKNGKTTAGNTDTKSDYNPAAIVVNSSTHMVITGNHAFDTTSGVQAQFLRAWGGGVTFPMRESVVTSNWVRDIADTSKFFGGTSGVGYQNVFDNNQARTSSDVIIPMAADTAIRAMAGGVEQWIPKWSSTGGGSTAISALTVAAATNTIDNTTYKQEWQWNTLAGTDALKLSSTSTAAASNAQTLLNIALSGANGTSAQTTYGLQVANTHTNATSGTNIGGYFTASGATTANYSIQTNSAPVDIQRNSIGTTSTDGLILDNTSGTTQYSPRLRFHAIGSQTVDFIQENRASGTAGTFALARSINGASYVDLLTVTSATVFSIPLNGATYPTFTISGALGLGSAAAPTTAGLSVNNLYVSGTQTNVIVGTGSLNATTAIVQSGLSMIATLGTTNPNASSVAYGSLGQMFTSNTAFTTAPAEFGGVVGRAEYSNSSATVFPLIFGTKGHVNLATGITANATEAVGLWSVLSANSGTPTGKAVTWKGVRIDSADQNFYTTNNYPIFIKGTNGTAFLASNTLIGWNGSATPALSSTKIIFQVQGDNTKGSIPAPRMTNTQRDAISSPDEGLLIYSTTDHDYEFYNGTVWKTITTN